MDADVLAEFECVCAESRRILRTDCMDCDICFYYNAIDTDQIAAMNPWSFFDEEHDPDENREVEFQMMNLEINDHQDATTPASLYPAPLMVTKQPSSPVVDDSFDDSLILPSSTEVEEDLDASIARRKAAINEALFKIGVISGSLDPISTYGAYELNRKESTTQIPTTQTLARRSLSIRRPRRSEKARPISGISIELYDQLADIPDDVPPTPATPELESPTSLNRISTTDESEESISDDELDAYISGHDPVIRRSSDPEQVIELSQEDLETSKFWDLHSEVTAAAVKDYNSRRRRLLKRSRPIIHL